MGSIGIQQHDLCPTSKAGERHGGAPRGPRLLLRHGARQRDAALGGGHPRRAGGEGGEAADPGGIPRRSGDKMGEASEEMGGLKPESI